MGATTHDSSLEEIVRRNVGAAVLAHHQSDAHRSGDGKAIVPAIYAGPGSDSPGEEFIRSAGYKDWVARFPDGGPASRGEYHGDPAQVSYRLGGRQLVSRALVTSADASAGSLVRPDRGPLEPGLALLTIRQLVSVIPVTSDQVDFPRETARATAAAPVAEATALTGTTGLKPEGALTFELVQVPIRTIAEWVAATKRIVSDADFLSAYINTALMDDIEETLEDQMLNGGGTGEDFLGILNTVGSGTLEVQAPANRRWT